VLQGSAADVDSEYFTIDTSTATAGEARTVTAVRARFLRIKVNPSHKYLRRILRQPR
jgi:hypothetical protein